MLGLLRIILVLAAILGALFFAVANGDAIVEVDYLFGSLEMWVPLGLLIALTIGVLTGYLVAWIKIARLRMQVAKLRREIKEAEEEVNNLRNIPLKDVH